MSVPLRTCVGCRKSRPKAGLVRLARGDDGLVVVDEAATAPGRGAYVCAEQECVERGLRRERLAHAFRTACRVTPELATIVLRTASREPAARGTGL